MSSLLHQAAQKAVEALTELADAGAEAWSEDRPCQKQARAAITELQAALQQQPEAVAQASALYEAIKHGDEEHKEWLRESLAAFFAGQPVPAPRGYGNKEARIAELECELSALQHQEVPREPVAWPEPSARDWPEDASHENGGYMNLCVSCGLAFTGHKRRVQCKACYACAKAASAASPSTTRQQEAGSAPEGFRLLPVEATDAMMYADWDVTMSDAHSNGGVSAAAWRAMVEAAPQVTYGDGHSGVGWYMHDTDYPEEGAVFLGAAAPSTPEKAGDGEGQR